MISLHSNTSAQSAMNQHRITSDELARTYEKLSTGNRINSARDDASGLATSVTLSSKVSGAETAIRNLKDVESLLSIRMGYQDTFINLMQRSRELVIQAGDPTLGTDEVDAIVTQMEALFQAALDMSKGSKKAWSGTEPRIGYYNNTNKTINIQYGADSSDSMTFDLDPTFGEVGRLSAAKNWIANGATSDNIRLALRELDWGIDHIEEERAVEGSMYNSVQNMISSQQTNIQNVTQSISRIKDTDFAQETAKLAALKAKEEVSMMAIKQSKVSSEIALQLLK